MQQITQVMFHRPRLAIERRNQVLEKGRESGEYSYGGAEIEGELSYDFLQDCKNSEWAAEWGKGEDNLKGRGARVPEGKLTARSNP